jgi:uncharacterized RDD family membrane protein YckC
MRCRYCGAVNHSGELRCVRCRHRLSNDSPPADPVVQTAVAPRVADSAPAAAPPPRRMEAHQGRGAANRAPRPTQRALFAYREPEQIVEIETYAPVRTRDRAEQSHNSAPRRRVSSRYVSPNQFTFDFDTQAGAGTGRPADIASRGLRAAATCFDAAIVLALAAFFAVVVRFSLGFLPAAMPLVPYYAGSLFFLALLYKVLWASFGKTTPGLNAANLRIVRFDGRDPRIGQRLGRVAMGWLGLAGGGLGLLWSLVDQSSLCWHDLVTGTYVTCRHDDDDRD